MVDHVRRAISISEKGIRMPKPAPARQIKQETPEETTKDVSFYTQWVEKSLDEQLVSGVVLQPEVVDAQGDIMSEDVIKKAAHRFLSDYNKETKLGLQHKEFKKRFDLLESYVVPQESIINNKNIKKGSWFVVVKVLDSKVWDLIKTGKITGFSIGGKAKVTQIKTPSAR